MLTHSPYAAWYEACIASKGKPDRHSQNPNRIQEHEIPLVSMDFFYTGKTGTEISEQTEETKLTALILHDSHTGAVHCVPVRRKDDVQHMVREAVNFHRFLGHNDYLPSCRPGTSFASCAVSVATYNSAHGVQGYNRK